MSNKHKRRKQTQRIPWILLVLGGMLVVLAVFLFARPGNDVGGTPSIAVDRQEIDYGDVKFNTNKIFAVKVTNTGDGTLRFEEKPYIQVLEGC